VLLVGYLDGAAVRELANFFVGDSNLDTVQGGLLLGAVWENRSRAASSLRKRSM
tara:strand:+ start:193 stop:354 length:162 start_codon:yes stop_codon:yes gene_type:complete